MVFAKLHRLVALELAMLRDSCNKYRIKGDRMEERTRQQLVFEAQKKSTGAAYLLWLFLGGFGAHRFYLGQTGTAVAQLLLLLLGWIPFGIGWGVLGLWLLVDLFLIPGIISRQNMELINTMDRGASSAAMAASRFE